MKNIIFKGLAGLMILLVMASCLPEDNLAYEGPALVEFKNQTLGLNDLHGALTNRGIVTNDASLTQTALSRGIFLNSGVVDTIYVQLVGPHVANNTEVSFDIAAESTAVEGQHYRLLPEGARTVTIPANSSVGYILTEPIANSLEEEGEIRFVQFKLNESQSPAPNKNYATFKLSFKR